MEPVGNEYLVNNLRKMESLKEKHGVKQNYISFKFKTTGYK